MAINPAETQIMVVDDSFTLRQSLRGHLASLGYTSIVEAENGLKAIETLALARANNKKFDLILCDWNMPVLNGIEFMGMMRVVPEWQNIPVIFLTAFARMEDIVGAASAGIKNYIVKPTNAAVVKEKIEAALLLASSSAKKR